MSADTEPLNFFVSVALKQRLRAYAKRYGISMSGAARLLLTQGLAQAERRAK
jgi:hypothetical protein